jgi:integrase
MAPQVRKVQVLKRPKDKSPNWYLRWWEPTPDGSGWKEKWRSTRTTVRREADRQRRELERELDAGRRAESDMPWGVFVELFLEKHAARKPATTLRVYRQCLKAFTDVVNPKKLAKVSHAVLEDFADKRLRLGNAAATVNRDLRHVRAALRWAKRRGLISEAPDFKGVFVREDRKKPTIIPEEDFMAMVRGLRKPDLILKRRSADWWRAFLYVANYLGLRRAEILGLTWGRVSFDTLEVRVLAATSKGRKERVVPMAPELGEVLRQWRDEQGNVKSTDAVLPWPYDTYRQLYEDWHAIQTAAGIPEGQHYVPKNCRSTCASELIAANVPTVVVKDFLGHATVATTENYYVNTKPALRAAATARKVRLEDTDEDENSAVPDGKM